VEALYITRHGGPEVLEVRQAPDPEPGPTEVRVRVHFAGLNFAEVMARQGLYPDAPKPPCVVGYEGSGVVDRVGSEVTTVEPGARVLFLKRFNAHASLVCVEANQAIPMPESMTFEEGAALPVNYLTAYHMLFQIARIRGGERVVIHMAAGGVGLAVLQLCRTVPGVVTFGTASASKHAVLRENGCQHPIDYRTLDYTAAIRGLTEDRGVDLVLDPLGGRDWKKGYKLLCPTGMLIAFGFANMNTGGKRRLPHVLRQITGVPLLNPMTLMNDNRAVAGVNMGHLFGEVDLLARHCAALIRLYELGQIKPHVHAAFPLAQAAEAHAALEYGKNVGKVLLKV
jgi:NADPH:quinone reductase-like Zn-dependent oxidoreductase